MPGKYAAETDVPVVNTKGDIEKQLKRYGASGFGYMTQGRVNAVMFEMHDRRIILRVELPDPTSVEMTTQLRSGNYITSRSELERRASQVERQRWRALLMVIKAKLESVESEIETFEEAWLSHIVLPSTGQTYGEFAIPQLDEVYRTHENPPMIPGVVTARIIELGERTGST